MHLSTQFVSLTVFFFVGAAITSIWSYSRGRVFGRFAIEIGVLALLAFGLYFLTGFPFPSSRSAFGGSYSVELALALMFVAVLLGIVASVVFNSSESITLSAILKPLMVAPIVTLPLIGSLQGAALEAVQLVSITFLSFQNGFFWREVLKNVRVTTQ